MDNSIGAAIVHKGSWQNQRGILDFDSALKSSRIPEIQKFSRELISQKSWMSLSQKNWDEESEDVNVKYTFDKQKRKKQLLSILKVRFSKFFYF